MTAPSWVDGDNVKPISKAIGDAWEAMDRLYYHSHTDADILKHADQISRALTRVRRETRTNQHLT
jgi:hypothetical protein